MTDPAHLRAAADRCDLHAATLDRLLDPVAAATGDRVWRGPAARRFEEELHLHRRRLADGADQLRATAHRLRLRAQAIEQRGCP